MTTIVLTHPNKRCLWLQVFAFYGGSDDRFTFALQEFDVRDDVKRAARKVTDAHEADHFRRIMRCIVCDGQFHAVSRNPSLLSGSGVYRLEQSPFSQEADHVRRIP